MNDAKILILVLNAAFDLLVRLALASSETKR